MIFARGIRFIRLKSSRISGLASGSASAAAITSALHRPQRLKASARSVLLMPFAALRSGSLQASYNRTRARAPRSNSLQARLCARRRWHPSPEAFRTDFLLQSVTPLNLDAASNPSASFVLTLIGGLIEPSFSHPRLIRLRWYWVPERTFVRRIERRLFHGVLIWLRLASRGSARLCRARSGRPHGLVGHTTQLRELVRCSNPRRVGLLSSRRALKATHRCAIYQSRLSKVLASRVHGHPSDGLWLAPQFTDSPITRGCLDPPWRQPATGAAHQFYES
jgi:hypothetical protein